MDLLREKKIEGQINVKDIGFSYMDLSESQDPKDFFDWCLKHKLYKQSSSSTFKSHLKVIYENERERYGGCSAIVAFHKNRPNTPIGICFVKKYVDNRPLNIQSKNYFDKIVSDKFETKESESGFLFSQVGILKTRSNKVNWKSRSDNFLINAGFLMLYIKPRYRRIGLASKMTLMMEKQKISSIMTDEVLSSKYEKEVLDNSFVCFTAQELAYLIVGKSCSSVLVTKCNPFDGNYKNFISDCGTYYENFKKFNENKDMERILLKNSKSESLLEEDVGILKVKKQTKGLK